MKPHRLDRTLGWRAGLAAGLALGGLLAAPTAGDAASLRITAAETPSKVAPSRFIVQTDGDSAVAVGKAAVDLGGRVVATQTTLGTVVVDLPPSAAPTLRTARGVQAVTPDSKLTLHADTLTGAIGPTGLAGDMTNVARLTGATTFWKNGYTGQGIDVALLDSGVVPVNGLTTTNKLVMGPDLSFESQVPSMRHLDSFGHGTHMASIIGGRDNAAVPGTYATDNTNYLGMAPDARIISLKLADAQGSTDVSQVIAAIDWVVAFGRTPGLNIRVMNLSFGTDTLQDYRLDPLAHAAEVAWHRGVVVVASAGNGDGTRLGLANPAYHPTLLAVGAQDTKGTSDKADDTVPAFSQRGDEANGRRAPDVVAPGVSIVGLRAPGSFVDVKYGANGAVAGRFFKGSGTSQSAAVVSGAAALLLSQRPSLSPDQVKDLLRRTARAIPGYSSDAQGAGALDMGAAYNASRRTVATPALTAGGGSLDKARGRFKVTFNGVALSGEHDILGHPVNTTELAAEEASSDVAVLNGATWASGYWLAAPESGASWNGLAWTGATWAGATWAGATWAGATWAGATWAGATWAGGEWAGATWAGATWADAEWANALWSSAGWE